MLEEKFNELCATPSDINEHLPVLRKLADECETVIELGVRGCVSTYAFLASTAKKVYGYDIAEWEQVAQTKKLAGKRWKFVLADVLKVELPECDLLFIDTFHTATQLQKELELHAKKVRKYIAFHDTTTYWETGEQPYDGIAANTDCGRGLKYAIEPFLEANKEWKVLRKYENNNGLLILCK